MVRASYGTSPTSEAYSRMMSAPSGTVSRAFDSCRLLASTASCTVLRAPTGGTDTVSATSLEICCASVSAGTESTAGCAGATMLSATVAASTRLILLTSMAR